MSVISFYFILSIVIMIVHYLRGQFASFGVIDLLSLAASEIFDFGVLQFFYDVCSYGLLLILFFPTWDSL